MNIRDIDEFYNLYKHNIGTMNTLERRQLKESYSYEKWNDLLLKKSAGLRAIYEADREAYNRVLKPYLTDPSLLNEEIARHLLTHVDFFLSENYRDYGVTAPVAEVLIAFFEKEGDILRLAESHFFLAVALSNEQEFAEACEHFSTAIRYYDEVTDLLQPYHVYRLLLSYYFRFLYFCISDTDDIDTIESFYMSASGAWSKAPRELLSCAKARAFASILRNILFLFFDRSMDRLQAAPPLLERIIREEEEFQESLSAGESYDLAVSYIRTKQFFISGKITRDEYIRKLIELYRHHGNRYKVGYTYGEWNFMMLFDDEVTDENFRATKLFYIDNAFTYTHMLCTELLMRSDSPQLKDQLARSIYRYYLELPQLGGDGCVSPLLVRSFSVLIGYSLDEDLILESLKNLFVHRTITTAIHSDMVGRLARMIAVRIAEKRPELFMRCFDAKTPAEIRAMSGHIADFAYKAGLCHDIGKLNCTSVVNLQSRPILDEEFARIKNHPADGYELLLKSPVLMDYAMIALSHHITSDGLHGYPLPGMSEADAGEFARHINSRSDKIMIDLISICDSIDAATDALGRNYTTAKTFETVFEELKAGRGTRYNRELLDAMEADEELLGSLTLQISKNRSLAQYEVYRRYIKPYTHFMPLNEKYIRAMEESDLPRILSFPNVDGDAQLALYEECREHSYLIVDGCRDIYGILLSSPLDEDTLKVRQIYVIPENRRMGYGGELLEHLENNAHGEGFRRILLPDVKKGHYDKFGWRNGYTVSEHTGFLEKRI